MGRRREELTDALVETAVAHVLDELDDVSGVQEARDERDEGPRSPRKRLSVDRSTPSISPAIPITISAPAEQGAA